MAIRAFLVSVPFGRGWSPQELNDIVLNLLEAGYTDPLDLAKAHWDCGQVGVLDVGPQLSAEQIDFICAACRHAGSVLRRPCLFPKPLSCKSRKRPRVGGPTPSSISDNDSDGDDGEVLI